VLVLGDSAAGKSRSVGEAAIRQEGLRDRFLVAPHAGGLRRLLDEGIDTSRSVIWLDDLDKHPSAGLEHHVLARLLSEVPGAVIVATIRRSQLQSRQEGLADPWWRFLTNR
jgi:hypothetical protein